MRRFLSCLSLFVPLSLVFCQKDCHFGGYTGKHGTIFGVSHMRYACVNGFSNVSGCQIDDNRPMHVGEEVKEGGKTYRCSLMDKGIKYDECSVSELHDECITQRGFFTEMNITPRYRVKTITKVGPAPMMN
ncbi:hypothetical protein AAVH_05880 [Aphelenchoides avenae]|nr:hypothetical protein AAVH_05880 [Aphelenchus avenae]